MRWDGLGEDIGWCRERGGGRGAMGREGKKGRGNGAGGEPQQWLRGIFQAMRTFNYRNGLTLC